MHARVLSAIYLKPQPRWSNIIHWSLVPIVSHCILLNVPRSGTSSRVKSILVANTCKGKFDNRGNHEPFKQESIRRGLRSIRERETRVLDNEISNNQKKIPSRNSSKGNRCSSKFIRFHPAYFFHIFTIIVRIITCKHAIHSLYN